MHNSSTYITTEVGTDACRPLRSTHFEQRPPDGGLPGGPVRYSHILELHRRKSQAIRGPVLSCEFCCTFSGGPEVGRENPCAACAREGSGAWAKGTVQWNLVVARVRLYPLSMDIPMVEGCAAADDEHGTAAMHRLCIALSGTSAT